MCLSSLGSGTNSVWQGVIDPPEDGSYASMGMCRIDKYMLQTKKKTFQKRGKERYSHDSVDAFCSGSICHYTSLWEEDKTPRPWHRGKIYTGKRRRLESTKDLSLLEHLMILSSTLFVN